MKITELNLRKMISTALHEVQEEQAPVSEFSPPDRPLYLYIALPDDSNYETLSPHFSADAFGHGAYLHGHDILLIDGGAGLTTDQLKAVEAHEAAHAILGHQQFRNEQFEKEADELAIEMLQTKGYDNSAQLLISRLDSLTSAEETIKEVCGAISADIEDALATAQLAHLGQTRTSGESYLSHPMAVAELVFKYYNDDQLCAAALMHDALEDALPQGNVESQDEISSLIAGSFGDPQKGAKILAIVQSLTHEKWTPYVDYVLGLADNIPALRIKLSDMMHNLSSSPNTRQLAKYTNAISALESEFGSPPPGISLSHWRDLKDILGSLQTESLARRYIRELLEANEYEWNKSSKKNMLLDKEGMPQSDKDEQEEYLKSMEMME